MKAFCSCLLPGRLPLGGQQPIVMKASGRRASTASHAAMEAGPPPRSGLQMTAAQHPAMTSGDPAPQLLNSALLEFLTPIWEQEQGVLRMQATAFGFTCYAVIENRDSSLPPLLHHLQSLPRAPAASAHLGPHPAPMRSLRAFPPHQLPAASPRPALQTSSSGQSSKLVCYLVSRRAEPQLLQGGLALPPELLGLLQPDSAMWFPYVLVTPPLSVTVTCRGAVWTPETAVSTGPYV